MIIVYKKSTGRILTTYAGFPVVTETGGKAMVGGQVLINDLTVAAWKYIAEQKLARDIYGKFTQTAGSIPAVTPPVTSADLAARVAKLESDLTVVKTDLTMAKTDITALTASRTTLTK